MKRLAFFLALAATLAFAPMAGAAVSTFEDVTMTVPPAETYTGPGGGQYYNGSDYAGGFLSGDAWFANSYNVDPTYGPYWDGWAASNTTDTSTAGYTNQYSAITGGGVNDSDTYGVAYVNDYSYKSQLYFGYLSGDYAQTVDGFYVTNTTYAWDSMTNGDFAAKNFGGATGNDEDWFKLTVYGLNSGYERTAASVDFYLADYRFSDNSLDYIVDEWTWLDLSDLGVVFGLEFELTSSDVGDWGMNTPAYFAMDDLESNPVPVPAAAWLLGSGLLGLVTIRRRRI